MSKFRQEISRGYKSCQGGYKYYFFHGASVLSTGKTRIVWSRESLGIMGGPINGSP